MPAGKSYKSKSNKDIGKLIDFLVNDIEMNELRVQNGIKKIQNIYK